MRFLLLVVLAVAAAAALAPPPARIDTSRDDDFLKERPRVGDRLPDLTANTPDGTEVRLADLRGHHTVLVFGCLT